MSIFRQVVPSSNNQNFQYFLVWLSPNGGVRSWLFSHTDGSEKDTFDSIIIEGLDNVRSIPVSERKTVSAVTESLDAENFDYVKSILASDRVYIQDKSGNKTPIGLRKRNTVRKNTIKEYIVNISFVFQEADILNV